MSAGRWLLPVGGAVLPLAVAVAGACGGDRGDADTSFALREVARYGWPDLPADTAALATDQRRLSGGMIGEARAVLQTRDSTLYVLDAGYGKIIAFAPDGTVRRVIGGGEGEGPDEFGLPIDLAVDGLDRLAVLDQGLGRISFFEPGGAYGGQISLPGRRYRLLAVGDTLWTTRLAEVGEATSLGDRWRLDGTLVDTLPSLPEEDLAYGGGILLTSCPDGRVLVRVDRPGVWFEYHAGRWTRRGSPLHPEVEPPIVERHPGSITVFGTQASADDLACLSSGDVLQRYSRFVEPPDPESDSLPELERFLALFDRHGELRSRIQLDEAHGSGTFEVSPISDHLLVAIDDPYPVVVEYEVVRGGAASDSQVVRR